MKRNILYLLIFSLFAFMQEVSAQCVLPDQYIGNTGSNMTVFFTSGAIDALPISSDAPYIVAISPDGFIVGSAPFASNDLIGGQQSLAVWGDDSQTTELDGALAGDAITFQLVDGDLLYDLNLTFAGVNSFVANGQLPVIGASAELNCTYLPTYCEEGQWYPPYSGNTGNNMTLMLLEGFTSSLNTQEASPYLVAVSESNLVVGSSSVAANDLSSDGQTSLTIWGERSSSRRW